MDLNPIFLIGFVNMGHLHNMPLHIPTPTPIPIATSLTQDESQLEVILSINVYNLSSGYICSRSFFFCSMNSAFNFLIYVSYPLHCPFFRKTTLFFFVLCTPINLKKINPVNSVSRLFLSCVLLAYPSNCIFIFFSSCILFIDFFSESNTFRFIYRKDEKNINYQNMTNSFFVFMYKRNSVSNIKTIFDQKGNQAKYIYIYICIPIYPVSYICIKKNYSIMLNKTVR